MRMTNSCVWSVLLLCGVMISPVLKADVVENLYETELPVSNQSREKRGDVARQAMAEILVRVSGRNSAAALAMDEGVVPRATRYLQQFRYRAFGRDESVPRSAPGESAYTQKLWMRFDENSINKLLRQQSFPVWGKTRPATLVWLAVEERGRRDIIDNHDQHYLRKLLQKAAEEKGLPLRLPLMDLADQAKITVGDIWGNFEDRIFAASERYQASAVLVGRVSLGYSGKWQARWSLYINNRQHEWATENSAVTPVLGEAMAMTAESLAANYAQLASVDTRSDILLEVADVKGLAAYTRVVKYLEGLSVIKKVQPSEVNDDLVVFRLTAHSDAQGVAQAISLGHVLTENRVEPAPQPVAPGTTENPDPKITVATDISFRLVP